MKNKKILFLVPVIVICILVVAYIGLFSSKNIFLRGMKTLCNNVEKSYNELFDSHILELSKNNSVMTTTTIKPTITSSDDSLVEQFEQINNYSLLMKTGFDPKAKELFYNVNALENTNVLLDFNLLGKDKTLYLEIKSLFDKYIKIPVEEYDKLFENSNIDDLVYLKDITKDSILESFTSDDFKKSSEEIEIDGKKQKVNKINYELSEKSLNKMAIKLLNKIYKDNKALEILSKYSETSKEELKKEIKQMLEESKEAIITDDKILDVNVYTKGIMNDIVRYEISLDYLDTKIELNYSKLGKKTFINLEQAGQKLLEVITIKENDKKSQTSIKSSGYELSISKDDKKYNYELKGLEEIKISGEFSTKEKVISKDSEYQYDSVFNIVIESEGQSIKFNLDINNNVKIGKKLDMNIPSDAVEINDLSEEQFETIYNNFSKIPFMNDLYNTTQAVSSAQTGAHESSAYAYVDAVEKQIMIDAVEGLDIPKDGTYSIKNDGNVNLNSRVLKTNIKGEIPVGGTVTIESDRVADATIKFEKYTVTYEDGVATEK